MPKRMLDDSFLSSPSLARCSPRAQDAFPRFILLMDDFGCAEANPRVLLGRGWPLRDDVTERDVWSWLEEYVAAGMACLWTSKERRWVHLTGWNGPHGQKARAEYDANAPAGTPGRHGSKRKTPPPPADLVAAVMAGARRDADGKPPGVDREEPDEIPNQSVPAREQTGNQTGPRRETEVSREFPAPAVPVPVPVPVPDPVADPAPAARLLAGGRRSKVCLGVKGRLFVAACAKGLGHGLVPLTSSDEAGQLERHIEAHGGPESATAYVAAACRRRDNFDPQSVKLLLDMLGDPIATGAA